MRILKILRPGFLLAGLLLLLPLVAAGASGPPYTEGKDYQRINPPPALPTNTPPGTVQVAEFFWYDCPHCAHVEPELERWRKSALPHSAHFVRIPAVLGPRWEFMARVYYSARLLGVARRMTPLIFDAIHQQHINLDTLAAMGAFFARHGIPYKRFRAAMSSLEVQTRVRGALLRTLQDQVHSVPTLVVDGRYRVTADMAGGYHRMFRIAAWLAHRQAQRLAETG